jgi:hypothetical protein
MEKNLTQKILAKKPKTKGCDKAGRNSVKCKYYRDFRYRVNKLNGLNKHLSIHANDVCALAAKEKLGAAFPAPIS